MMSEANPKSPFQTPGNRRERLSAASKNSSPVATTFSVVAAVPGKSAGMPKAAGTREIVPAGTWAVFAAG